MSDTHLQSLFPHVVAALDGLQALPAYRALDQREMTRRVHLFLNAVGRARWAAESGRDHGDTTQALLRELELARNQAAHEPSLTHVMSLLEDAIERRHDPAT